MLVLGVFKHFRNLSIWGRFTLESPLPAHGAAQHDDRAQSTDEGGRPEDHGGQGRRDGAEVARRF